MRSVGLTFARLAWLGLAMGCAPSIAKDPTPAESAATIARFAPDSAAPCASVLPFPTDLGRNPTTGGIDAPYCTNDDATTTQLKMGMRTLDGYATTSVPYVTMSRAIDPATAAAAVMVINKTTGVNVKVTPTFDAATLRLYLPPSVPFAQNTTYIVLITNKLADSDGKPVASDQVFTLAKSTEKLIDDNHFSRYSAFSDADANALEQLRLGYAPLFAQFEALGIPRQEVAVAWTFTTQSVTSTLPTLGALATSAAPTVFADDVADAPTHPLLAAAGLPTSNLCSIHIGRIELNTLLGASGTFVAGADGKPVVARTPVDYLLITPKVGATCAAWDYSKLAIYVHGLGRCKNDALTLANGLASIGYATLTLDGPSAGARTVTSLGDLNLDSCPDQGAIPDLIAVGGNSPNPFGIRDRLREWGFEVLQAVELAKSAPWELVGATSPGATSTSVAVIGHSFGGMAAVLAASLGTNIDELIVTATAGGFASVFGPVLTGGIADQLKAVGVDVTTATGAALLAQKAAEAIATYAWVLEPADPIFAASVVAERASGANPQKLLAQTIAAGGTMADAPMHAVADQQALATALGQTGTAATKANAAIVCSAGAVEEPLCDSSTSAVGAMLKPCVEDQTSNKFPLAYGRTATLQTQIVTFVATGGTVVAPLASLGACP